jgi:hypothetical protein
MSNRLAFTLRPLYHRENKHRYPLDKSMGGPQGHCEEEKNLVSLPGLHLYVKHTKQFYNQILFKN